ncbi:MAG: TetR/AcrR family transcriptional regulator [Gemmatimonadales bacterium]
MLVEAIHAATLAELAETGYAGLSVERVALRARTSKAAIYRRWPARADLVADAIGHAADRDQGNLPDTGDVRADLFAVLRTAADRLTGPYGEAARGLITETLADPDATRAARERLTGAQPADHRGARARRPATSSRPASTDAAADFARAHPA